jgi:hypothetical protein
MKTSDVTADIARAHLRRWALRAAPIVEDVDVLEAIIRPLSPHSLPNAARERLRLSQHALRCWAAGPGIKQWHIQLEILTLDPPRREGTISPQSRTWGRAAWQPKSRPSTNDRSGSAHLTASVAHA